MDRRRHDEVRGWVFAEGWDPEAFFGSSLENQLLNSRLPEKTGKILDTGIVDVGLDLKFEIPTE